LSLTFAQLGVPEKIVKALDRRGITTPFEIQAATLADALEGRDVCGRAPTGSGKTMAFGIPLIAKVSRAESRRPHALILAPTRELAEQITTEMKTFANGVRIHAVYGGVGYGPQYNALRQGVDILVACPGRLEDLIAQKALKLDEVQYVVVDEADRMADMGFMPAVRRLLDQTAEDRQTMLYSATLDGDVAKLTRDYQTDAVRHEVGDATPDITSANHVFWKVTRANRNDLIADAVNAAWPAIIFCRTRHGSDRLAKQLEEVGIKSGAIHGGRSQGQRMRALAAFASGKVQALVASDVAARGIHVDNVAAVVHFDPPDDHKTYVHRSGRTARAGQGGIVLSLVLPDQARETRRMQRQVGIDEPFITPDAAALREMAPTPVFKAAPSPKPVELVADDRSELVPWSERTAEQQEWPSEKPQRSQRPFTPRDNSRGQAPRAPYQGNKSQGSKYQGNRPQGSKPPGFKPPGFKPKASGEGRPSFDNARRSADAPRRSAAAGRPFERPSQSGRKAEGAREGASSGQKPWDNRKPNQFSRAGGSAPKRKGFADRPFASGAPSRKSRRAAEARSSSSK
jgi:superfamily II DNA/RNA helicase